MPICTGGGKVPVSVRYISEDRETAASVQKDRSTRSYRYQEHCVLQGQEAKIDTRFENRGQDAMYEAAREKSARKEIAKTKKRGEKLQDERKAPKKRTGRK